MRLHCILIATIALAFGGVMQASAAAPAAQAAAAPSKTTTGAAATTANNVEADSEKVVPMSKLMTPDERKAFREKMRSLKTLEERQAFRVEQHKLMETRAAERGEKLRPILTREEMQARAAAHEKKVPANQEKQPPSADQHPAR